MIYYNDEDISNVISQVEFGKAKIYTNLTHAFVGRGCFRKTLNTKEKKEQREEKREKKGEGKEFEAWMQEEVNP